MRVFRYAHAETQTVLDGSLLFFAKPTAALILADNPQDPNRYEPTTNAHIRIHNVLDFFFQKGMKEEVVDTKPIRSL